MTSPKTSLRGCLAALCVAGALALSFTSTVSAAVRGFNMAFNPADTQSVYQNAYNLGARVVRLSCANSNSNLASYDAVTNVVTMNETNINALKTHLGYCRNVGLKVIISPHYVFGSSSRYTLTSTSVFWTSSEYGDAWAYMWTQLAQRLRTQTDTLYGYSLINEPSPLSARSGSYRNVDINSVYQKCVRNVRAQDPNRNLLVMFYEDDFRDKVAKDDSFYLASSDQSSGAKSRIHFDTHLYWPLEYTHQGIDGRPVNQPWPRTNSSGQEQGDSGQNQRMGWISAWMRDPNNDGNTGDTLPASRMWVSEFGLSSGTNMAWNQDAFEPTNNADGWLQTVYGWIHANQLNFCVHSLGGNSGFDVTSPAKCGQFVTKMLQNTAPGSLP